MTRLLLYLLAAGFAAALPAAAQQMNERDSPCRDAVTTIDLRRCFDKAREEADAELNALYKEVRGKLDGEDEKRLVAAQRLWIQYRDANCTAERELYARGTAAGPVYLACMEAMTRARTKELRVTYAVRLK